MIINNTSLVFVTKETTTTTTTTTAVEHSRQVVGEMWPRDMLKDTDQC